MAYIDKEYIENLIGPGTLSGALYYGGITSAQTGSVLGQFISASSGWVDSFVDNAGYEVPLSSVPENLKLIVAWKTLEGLYLRSNREIPTSISDQIKTDTGYLLALSEGKVSLPGLSEDQISAAQGGHSFPSDDPCEPLPYFGSTFIKGW